MQQTWARSSIVPNYFGHCSNIITKEIILLIQGHKVREHKVEMSLIKFNKYAYMHTSVCSCICLYWSTYSILYESKSNYFCFSFSFQPWNEVYKHERWSKTSSVLFSGKIITQHISLITFDHISSVHSECSSFFVCYCVCWTLHRIYFKDIFWQNLTVQIYKYTTYLLTFLSAASVQRYTYCTSE